MLEIQSIAQCSRKILWSAEKERWKGRIRSWTTGAFWLYHRHPWWFCIKSYQLLGLESPLLQNMQRCHHQQSFYLDSKTASFHPLLYKSAAVTITLHCADWRRLSLGWVWNNKCLSLTFLGIGSPRWACRRVQILVRILSSLQTATRSLCSHRAKEVSVESPLQRKPIRSWRPTLVSSSTPHYFPEAHLLVSSHWEEGVQHINLKAP